VHLTTQSITNISAQLSPLCKISNYRIDLDATAVRIDTSFQFSVLSFCCHSNFHSVIACIPLTRILLVMLPLWRLACFTIGTLQSVKANDFPILGIFTQPTKSNQGNCNSNCTYIAASYVKVSLYILIVFFFISQLYFMFSLLKLLVEG